MKNPGDLVRDRYKILEHIAKSRYGNVYKALDQTGNREVALKILEADATSDQNVVKRIIKEGEVLSTLKHRAIVKFYSMEMEGPTPFLVMEYLKGNTMAQRKNDLRKDLRSLFSFFLELLDGVDACHQSRVYHRNLAPENIIITTEGQLKIIDFRFAKTREKLTRVGELIGIPEYMAPEQCEGKGPSEAADVYSIGVIIWEMLIGEVPFPLPKKDGKVEVMDIIAMLALPLPIEKFDAVPRFAVLRDLMQRILDKSPKYRPSIQEIASSLKREIPGILASASNQP